MKKLFILAILIAIVAFGYFGYKYLKPSNQPIKNSVEASPKIIPVVNFKTYTNTKYNYEVKYPENYNPIEDTSNDAILDFVSFNDIKTDDPLLSIEVYKSDQKGTIAYVKNIYSHTKSELISEKKKVINGMESIILEFTSNDNDPSTTDYIFTKGDYSYILYTKIGEVNNILEGFKFTN